VKGRSAAMLLAWYFGEASEFNRVGTDYFQHLLQAYHD